MILFFLLSDSKAVLFCKTTRLTVPHLSMCKSAFTPNVIYVSRLSQCTDVIRGPALRVERWAWRSGTSGFWALQCV